MERFVPRNPLTAARVCKGRIYFGKHAIRLMAKGWPEIMQKDDTKWYAELFWDREQRGMGVRLSTESSIYNSVLVRIFSRNGLLHQATVTSARFMKFAGLADGETAVTNDWIGTGDICCFKFSGK